MLSGQGREPAVGSFRHLLMAVLTTPFSMQSPEAGVPYGDVVPEGHLDGEPDLAGQNDPYAVDSGAR